MESLGWEAMCEYILLLQVRPLTEAGAQWAQWAIAAGTITLTPHLPTEAKLSSTPGGRDGYHTVAMKFL